jgi:hypothetical protein
VGEVIPKTEQDPSTRNRRRLQKSSLQNQTKDLRNELSTPCVNINACILSATYFFQHPSQCDIPKRQMFSGKYFKGDIAKPTENLVIFLKSIFN